MTPQFMRKREERGRGKKKKSKAEAMTDCLKYGGAALWKDWRERGHKGTQGKVIYL